MSGVKRIALSAAALFLLGSCGESENSLRYKMTVEVDTPQGVKSGFAVREMTLNSDNLVGGPKGRIRGEAVVVDLPGGKTLFALLTGGDGEVDYAMQIGGRAQVWGKSPDTPVAGPIELYPIAPRTSGLANTNPLPMLAIFRDMTNPKSVERIEPSALDAVFGPHVKLKRITVAATNEAVTVSIGRRLPSYGPETGFDEWYKTLKYGDPRAIGKYDFQRGTNQ
jgi:hypothetical protein